MTVMVIRGNRPSRSRPCMRDRMERCAPSMQTGTMGQPALSASMPGPPLIFINEPVTVIRPSGKMQILCPSARVRASSRVPIGLVGSMVTWSASARKGLAQACCAMKLSTAKRMPGRKAASSAPSRKDWWFGVTTAAPSSRSRCSAPRSSTRKASRKKGRASARPRPTASMASASTTAASMLAPPQAATVSGATPSASMAAAMPEPTTMNSALTTLAAAITRARAETAARCWISA